MIPFAIGALVGAGCLAVYNELYIRWLEDPTAEESGTLS